MIPAFPTPLQQLESRIRINAGLAAAIARVPPARPAGRVADPDPARVCRAYLSEWRKIVRRHRES